MPSKINKMIKKIKTMKIFKKKNKSYEKDIQEDMVFTTSFGTKERIESMNSGMVNNMDVAVGHGHRRDLDFVNIDGLKEKAPVGLDSLKTSAMNSVDVKDMNVDGLKEKASVGLDSLKTSAMNSVDVKDMNVDGLKEKAPVDVKDMNVDGLKEKAPVGLDSLKTSAMNSVDVKDMNVDGLKEKGPVGFDSLKTSAMNSVKDMNVDGLKEKAPVGFDSLKKMRSISIDSLKKLRSVDVNGLEEKKSIGMDSYVKNMNFDGLKERASIGMDSLKTYLKNMNVDGLKEKNMNVDEIKSNAIVVNKKIDTSEHEFIREKKSLSMDSGLKEIDSVEDHYLKRSLSMDSMDFNDINVNKEEWYYPRLESIKEERECNPFEWIKKCFN